MTRVRIAARAPVAIAALLVCSLSPDRARAEEPPFDRSIGIQLFEYAIGPRTFLTVGDAAVAAPGQLAADVLLTFMTDPFMVYDVDQMSETLSGARTRVVGSMLAGELSGAYGVTRRLQLGAAVPLILAMRGDGIEPGTGGGSGGLEVRGIGDVRVEAKLGLVAASRAKLALIGGVMLPTNVGSGGGAFLGDDLPGARGAAAVQWSSASGGVNLGINAGIILRKPREIYATPVGQQLTYGGAISLRANSRTALVGELFGRFGLPDTKIHASPLEASGAIRLRTSTSTTILAGGGAGIVPAIGSPALRVFVAAQWSPDNRDDDGDGIVNVKDACPLAPEDRDGFEDTDGCPDPDNDGDKRLDAEDKCPNQSEDFDGYSDDDGCPDLDNDNDGIPDLKDSCPLDAEDGEPPDPGDGCPLKRFDSDGDGIKDDVDRCRDEPEDKDGFEDADGCPDPDNDGDGIADKDDRCPLCAENKNGVEDDDGCPEIAPAVKLVGDRLVLSKPITFKGKKLTSSGRAMVDQVAALMKQHREVTKWLVVVGVKQKGSKRRTRKLASGRTATIEHRLTARGVSADRVRVAGAIASADKLGFVARQRDDSVKPSRVCPARLRAKPRKGR